MTNYFEPTPEEICFLTIQDVKDSLKGDFLTKTDAELGTLILKAQDAIKCHFSAEALRIPVEKTC